MSPLQAWALVVVLALAGLALIGLADVAWDRVRMARRRARSRGRVLRVLPTPRGCGNPECWHVECGVRGGAA